MSETRAAADDSELVGKRFFKRIEKESKETAEKLAKVRTRNIRLGLLLTGGVTSICEYLFRHSDVPIVLTCLSFRFILHVCNQTGKVFGTTGCRGLAAATREEELVQPHYSTVYEKAIQLEAFIAKITKQRNHILKTPNFVSGIGAFSDALIASPRTRRVSAGSMMPSSHSLAVA